MRVYRTGEGARVEDGKDLGTSSFSFDELFRQSRPAEWLRSRLASFHERDGEGGPLRAPIEGQEVWAAGVTYYRSREARMEESEKEADVYDRVYGAERPELFFKATPHRVVGPGGEVVIRKDSDWNVPEPELVLAVNSQGRIFGYTIGNDMSSRSIEGENPLYLPQAKVYDGSCALGPCLYLSEQPLPADTAIELCVSRGGTVEFEGSTRLSMMKRRPEELVSYLFRHSTFPNGCYLLTGTGIIPPSGFSLHSGDEIRITVEPIGSLTNRVR